MDLLKNSFTTQGGWLECAQVEIMAQFSGAFLEQANGWGVSSAKLKRHQLQDFLGSSAWWVCRLEPEKIRDFSSNASY